MTMKKGIFFLSLLLLAACAPATAPPTPTTEPAAPTPACTTPGITGPLTVDTVGQIVLYLPPCFDPRAATPYPVLYLLPGQGGGPQDWDLSGLAYHADASIRSGEIRPLLIVMTDDTFEDITHETITGGLIPFIEAHYPVSRDRRDRAIAGGSLGGASAYLLAFERPDLFSSAGIFGNGLITGYEDETRAMLAALPPNLKPRVFLGSGEGDTYMLGQAQLLIPLLDEARIEHSQAFIPGGHDYFTWLSTFPAYFRWLEAGWE